MEVAVAGLGLIGGSFVKALAARTPHTVRVWNRTRATAEQVVREGYAQSVLGDDFSQADIIIVCLPPAAVTPWIDAHQATFKPGAIVTDVTGVKRTICAELRKYALQTRWTFVGGHPMAGKEVSGWEHASARLYEGASMIFTPFPSTGRGPLDALEKFSRELGFTRVVFTSPKHHDEMIALTSQLAHVVSSCYVRDPLAKDHTGYSAGSFRDMTRVARLDPALWTDLFLANREPLSVVLGRLIDHLSDFKKTLDAQDADGLQTRLAEGLAIRELAW